jgi:uncharacterized membrane protein YeaQ/YmgE (transglycosylase-associated protein family)
MITILVLALVGLIGAWIGGRVASSLYKRAKEVFDAELPEPISTIIVWAVGAFIGMRLLTWWAKYLIDFLRRTSYFN